MYMYKWTTLLIPETNTTLQINYIPIKILQYKIWKKNTLVYLEDLGHTQEYTLTVQFMVKGFGPQGISLTSRWPGKKVATWVDNHIHEIEPQ